MAIEIKFGEWRSENESGLISRYVTVDKGESGSTYGYEIARRDEKTWRICSLGIHGGYLSVTERDRALSDALRSHSLLDARLAAARLAQWSH